MNVPAMDLTEFKAVRTYGISYAKPLDVGAAKRFLRYCLLSPGVSESSGDVHKVC